MPNVIPGVPEQQPIRAFDDHPKAREAIFQNVLNAISTRFPIENQRYSMHIENPRYDEDKRYSFADQKKMILQGGTLSRKLMGDWVLKDKVTGAEIDRRKKMTLAHVPYLTERGTFISNGTEYTIANQARLRPGVYSRVKENGELEAHVNVRPGTGRSFKVYMEPDTGVFRMGVGQSTLKLYPVLRAMGLSDDEMGKSWGNDLLQANIAASDARAVARAHAQLVRTRDVAEQEAVEETELTKESEDKAGKELRETLERGELDSEVTTSTLGEAHERVSPNTILRTTNKLLNIQKGSEDVDDRDALAFQQFYSPEDFFAERITKDAGQNLRKLLWKSTLRGNLSQVPSGALTKQLNSVLLNSGLGSTLEEVNPYEVHNQTARVTRLGVGGISNIDAVPDESRSVTPSQFGVIDILLTPESSKVGIDTRFAHGVMKGPNHTVMMQVKRPDGSTKYLTTAEASKTAIAFPGEFAGDSKKVRALVNGSKIDYVPRSEVEFELPHASRMFSATSNLIPFIGSMKGGRVSMGARMVTQSLPLRDSEAPLVRSESENGNSFNDEYGKVAGVVRSDMDGIVTDVARDGITVQHADGSVKRHDLYDNFPLNRKSVIGTSEILIKKVNGQIWRGEIQNYNFEAGDRTLSLDSNTCVPVWGKVTGYLKHKNDKKLYRVKYESGREVIVTEDHSLITLDELGNLSPVYPMDCVCKRTLSPIALLKDVVVEVDNKEMSYDLGCLIGLYLSEGHIAINHHPNVVMIAVKDAKRVDEVIALVKRVFPSVNAYKNSGCVCFSNAEFAATLVDVYGHLSHNKRIPSGILQTPEHFRRGIICGYLSGDGCLWADGKGAVHVYALSVSQALRDNLIDLFSTLGIFATKSFRKLNDINVNWRDGYGLRILTKHIQKLSPMFLYSDREEKLKNVLEDRPATRASIFDRIPIVNKKARTNLYREFPKQPNHYMYKSASAGFLARTRFVESTGKFTSWAQSGNVYWDLIISLDVVDHSAVEFVYDLSVEGCENFAVNGGLIVHNTFWHSTPNVQVGEQVKAGGLLAHSNYTDKQGAVATGKNLRVAYIPWGGKNYEDAIAISESAAERLTSEHLYQHVLPLSDQTDISRKSYIAQYPTKFKDQQLKSIDDKGVIKPGSTVRFGDPLILALEKTKYDAVHRGRAPMFTDGAVTWKHYAPGEVTDVAQTSDGSWNVTVKSYARSEIGDKLSNRFGGKGVISDVIPDAKMPHDKDGRPMEVLLNPLGIVSRGNPSQMYEAALGKVARKIGKPINVPHFMPGKAGEFTKALLAKHGVSDTEDLTDPDTGRKIPNVFTGETYMMKLHHTAESKGKAREIGGYTMDELPAKGQDDSSKRIANMESAALISHGAVNVLKDARLIRGQKNEDWWKLFRMGMNPPSPKVPMIYDKFLSSLQGAGINLTKTPDSMHLYAMSQKDAESLIDGGEIRVPETFRSKDLEPVEGGLFDIKLTGGHAGSKWSKISLPEPVPNPVMEEPLRKILGLTQKKYEAIIAGKEDIHGFKGGAGLAKYLATIDLDKAITTQETIVKSGARSKRDDAIKALGYLKSMKTAGFHPKDFMMTTVPVLPPKFRPIAKTDSMTIISDPNYLYRDLMSTAADLKELSPSVGLEGSAEERLRMYNAFKAVTGLGDPVNAKTQERSVRGLLKHVFGSSPKAGTYQRRVLGIPTDVVGRGVVIPDADLNMDQIGIPENKAWVVYRSFIVRRLVRGGMPATEAVKAVAEQKPEARKALEDELQVRPVMMNRAPTLHRYNFMAFMPKLIKDKTIHVSPVVTKGFGMDFDGNCILGSSRITLDISRRGAIFTTKPSEGLDLLVKEIAMKFGEKTKVVVVTDDNVVLEAEIKDVPYEEATMVLDKNGAKVFDVPAGMRVLSVNPKTGKTSLERITQLTIEDNVETAKVVTRGGLEVIASTNESLCVYDHKTGELVKCAPKDAPYRLSPVAGDIPAFGTKGNYEFGWMLGAFISDGFFTRDTVVGYSKLSDAHRQRFADALQAYEGRAVGYTTHRQPPDGIKKLGHSTKEHFHATEHAAKLLHTCYAVPKSLRDENKKSALYKTLPDLSEMSRETLVGALAGFLDGDGSVSINHRAKSGAKMQLTASYSTSSPYLRDSLTSMCWRLGIRVGVTAYQPKEGRLQKHEAYLLTFCQADIARIKSELKLCSEEKMAVLAQILPPEEIRDDRDIVPVPEALMLWLTSSKCPILGKDGLSLPTLHCVKGERKPYWYVTRAMARKIAKHAPDTAPGIAAWRILVDAIYIRWDLIKEVTLLKKETVYDLIVPTTKIFAVNGGLIVYDTANYHVPTSDDAVKEAKEKMLPSKNLLSVKNFGVHYLPSQELLYGLYLASRKTQNKQPRVFADKNAAIQAYRRGELRSDDPIIIGKQ